MAEGFADFVKKGLVGLGLMAATSVASAQEPAQISPDQREQLWRAQQVRNELAKIPKSWSEEAQDNKAILAARCSAEFKRVTDPVSGKIYAEPETKACVAFKPAEQKLTF